MKSKQEVNRKCQEETEQDQEVRDQRQEGEHEVALVLEEVQELAAWVE